MGTSGLKDLIWISQLGMSLVSPLALCVLGAVWLRNRFDWGDWVIFVGLLLGLGGAISAAVTFIRRTKPKETKKKLPPPVNFSEHD